MDERVSPAVLADLEFMQWLVDECGYRDVRPLLGRRWAAIWPLMYTHAILVGPMGCRFGYDDRWCYEDYESAKSALESWDGAGEPSGWHRHPATGRRRTKADPAAEYVAP